MSIFEYDEKAVRQVYYEDGLQAGRKDGIKTGILNMLRAKKYSLEEISEVFQVPVEEIEQIKKQQNIYHFKPMNKRSKQEVLFPESCRRCDCSNKDFAEWTCEGSLKLYLLFLYEIYEVGTDGGSIRYQQSMYECT